MLIENELAEHYWAEVINTANHVLNNVSLDPY